jgi:hypothetical protein
MPLPPLRTTRAAAAAMISSLFISGLLSLIAGGCVKEMMSTEDGEKIKHVGPLATQTNATPSASAGK